MAVLFEKLSNGLELLVRESHAAPVAEVQIWARVGSADERPDELGLAHFHEHMLFKGTHRRGVGEIAGEIEGVGGHINAFTSFDTTVYHATVPSAQTDVALDVLCDAVRDPLFEATEIAAEVEVVLEEIRRSEDSPHHVLSNAVFAEAYRRHPYREPILGPPESVSRFDPARVRAFFERWYAPNHLFVVVTGEVDAQRVLATVRETFGGTASSEVRGARPAEPPESSGAGPRSVILARPFERANIDLCIRTLPLAHPDAPLLDLLAFVLGEGESSRLVQRLKEQEECVDRIDAYSYTPLDPGLFGVTADLAPERVADAIASCAREIERLCSERISNDELDKAKANFLASEHFERESVSGLARKLGGFHALAGDYRLEARMLEAIRTATPEMLLRAAQTHLSTDLITVGALLPESAGDVLDAEAVARAVARGREDTRHVFATPRHRGTGGEVHSFELETGAQLHVWPRHETPVVAVRAALPGGLLVEEQANAGLTSFLTCMWTRGTRTRSASDFARSVESLAAEIDGFSGRSSLGLTLDCLSDRLDPSLALFAEALLEPAFAPEEVEKERRDTLAALERREDRLGARAFDVFQEALYGGTAGAGDEPSPDEKTPPHPYRFPVIGRVDSVRGFGAEQIAAHHSRLVRAPNLVLAVAGDVEPEAVAAGLSSRLTGLESTPAESPENPTVPRPRTCRERVLRKDRAQAHLVLGFLGLTVSDPDREALEVISQILGGQGGRLFLELRDRKSLAYSVSAMHIEGVGPGFFATYIATAPDKLDGARSEMLDQLERVVSEAPPARELEAAKQHLVGSFAIDQQRSASRATHLALDVLYGLGLDAQERYPARVLAVTREDVLRVAQRVIDPQAYVLAEIRP